jgi:hypothetical protein
MDSPKKRLRKFTSYANAPGTIESRLKRQAIVDRSLGIDPKKKRRPEQEYKIIFPASDKSQQNLKS